MIRLKPFTPKTEAKERNIQSTIIEDASPVVNGELKGKNKAEKTAQIKPPITNARALLRERREESLVPEYF